MSKKVKVSFWIEASTINVIDEIACSRGVARGAMIRTVVNNFAKRQPVISEADYRRAYSSEICAAGIDLLVQIFAPEHREQLLAAARQRTEQLYEI